MIYIVKLTFLFFGMVILASCNNDESRKSNLADGCFWDAIQPSIDTIIRYSYKFNRDGTFESYVFVFKKRQKTDTLETRSWEDNRMSNEWFFKNDTTISFAKRDVNFLKKSEDTIMLTVLKDTLILIRKCEDRDIKE